MAEAVESEPVPSSSENVASCDIKDDGEPLPKKRRISDKETSDKLEHRLGGILCCAVCLDLPKAAVYQCSNGHLMCAPCFTHLLADARLRDEAATCPNCRVEISKTSASRNLAVEKTVSELPSECKYCTHVFPRHSIQHHEDNTCEEREFKFSQVIVDSSPKRRFVYSLVRIASSVYTLLLEALRRALRMSLGGRAPSMRRQCRRLTGCRYSLVGCPWRGPAHQAADHERACAHPQRAAGDVLPALLDHQRRAAERHAVLKQLADMLSYEKIAFNDLQLKPYRTEEFVHKLYYETSRFSVFGHQWVVKAFVNKNQRDPTQSSQREITYQLILKSKLSYPLPLQWVWLCGPYGEARVRPRVHAHAFRDEQPDSPPQPLPLELAHDANRLLANKAIHFRLIMFLSSQ